MNTTIPVLLVLLVTVVQTIMAYPAQSDDWEYTADDCPPGIWVCRKKRVVDIPKPEESNDCPPGIWTCQKKRNNAVQPESLSADSDECPPGIWTCRRKRALKASKEMALNAAQDVDVRRKQIIKRLMTEKARETAKMLNAARRQAPLSQQMKRSYDCPPGIWVC
jgi:hypothetical protein